MMATDYTTTTGETWTFDECRSYSAMGNTEEGRILGADLSWEPLARDVFTELLALRAMRDAKVAELIDEKETSAALCAQRNQLAKQRDELLAALEGLCSFPQGSHMCLGAHDRGPHYSAAVDAWNVAHDALAKFRNAKPAADDRQPPAAGQPAPAQGGGS